ncbi:sulfate reduction electron transfer complex DsrMKJOP subunit DsrK [Curtanaerobium respiraculi]|uniref:sulfate reduction electron transfer complex DsrMKJOP subunit DsrK n=1 Tax=Curtanaerobium respiraculi TaxID=2949669 RepID=UPI0024B355C1|nr:(Fe-S)-binding protein [Curtanaerobium respiraculi]
MSKTPDQKEMFNFDYSMPEKGWMHTPTEFKEGMYCYGTKPDKLETIGFPHPHKWSSSDEDWNLPENWKEIILNGMEDLMKKYRSFKLFMDVCVRCGACADKCHFYMSTGDPKNMPVIRAELLRSVYKRYFTTAGKLFGEAVGARDLTEDVLKEWWYYFFQCTECRRCSLFCPYGIDQAEITIMGRELLNLIGLNTDWIAGPVANCYMKGNHVGLEPQAIIGNVEFMMEDLEDVTGHHYEPSFNRKGAEILLVVPSGDLFAEPGTFTFMGYITLLEHLGIDYTLSTYASEGGNFGFFTTNEMAKRLNAKIYAEAERLGVKWILGGECGHMWRVMNQYMDTWNGPADFLEQPVSPITGTVFHNAASTKMVHICEFTADLIHHDKLKFDKSRNDHLRVTFHDSCNPARGMGMFEEPRYIIKNVCNNFFEMPDETIRERTLCCGSGAGLNAGENMELRLRGGMPRAEAVRSVRDKYGVNTLANICAIDRVAFPPLMDYWVPGTRVTGVHEMVANALILDENDDRQMDMRLEELPSAVKKREAAEAAAKTAEAEKEENK